MIDLIDTLKAQVEEKKYVDISKGAEQHFGVTLPQLKAAIYVLKKENYEVHFVTMTQDGTGEKFILKILVAPKTSSREIYEIIKEEK